MVMKPNNAANVSTGKPKVGGAVFVAPLGTLIPADALEALDAAFENIGYCSDEGIVNGVSEDNLTVKAYGGQEVLSEPSSRSETYNLTFIETNLTSMQLRYGDENVAGTDEHMSILHNAKPRLPHVFAIDTLQGNKVRRQIIPNGRITSIGDTAFKDNDAIKYPATIAAIPDEAGNTAYEHIDGPGA